MENTTSQQLEPSRRAWVETISMLLRHKVLILSLSFLVTVASAVYLFGFAKIWYKSTANVLPARKSGGGMFDNIASGLTNAVKDLGLTQLAGRGKTDGVYSPLALVQSRTLAEQVINEFGLMKEYEAETIDDAVSTFSELASADVLEEGNIAVTFEDTDPKRSADIANRLVRGLNELNSRMAIEEARFNKVYIEQRYASTLAELDSVEQSLGAFQRKYGVYELKTQAQAQLTALALLEQQRYTTEIQLQNSEQLYGTQAVETNVLRTQLQELRTKLGDLKTGMDKNASTYFVPMDVLPDVALEYLRLTRDFEILSKLKAFLIPSVEQARMDETRQMLNYIVLDSAVVPTKKSRPKRASILAITFLATAATLSLLLVAKNSFDKAKRRYTSDLAQLNR